MNWLIKLSGLWDDINKYSPEDTNIFTGHKYREEFNRNFGWSVPTLDVINQLKEFIGNDQVLEVGAGKGTWAKLMQDAGIQVTPTDLFSGRPHDNPDEPSRINEDNQYWKKEYIEDEGLEVDRNTFTPVYKMDAEQAVKTFGDHTVLFLNWPPYDNPMANNAIQNFSGNKIIYIGEGMGGCTGDDCFHNNLENEWTEVDQLCIPQWPGIHDCVTLYVRKQINTAQYKWNYVYSKSTKKFNSDEARQLGEQVGINWDDSPFPVEEFRKGLEIEMEHGSHDPETDVTHNDPELTAKITWAHLKEISDYYTKLIAMEHKASNFAANWKYSFKTSQKSMPLPIDKPPSGGYHGLNRIDNVMLQEISDQVKEEYKPEYLGHGDMGVAMTHTKSDSVLKLTEDYREARTAKLQQVKNYPFLVKIFQVKQIQNNPDPLWLIEMEKVQTLNYWQKNVYLSLNFEGSYESNLPLALEVAPSIPKEWVDQYLKQLLELKQELSFGNSVRSKDAHTGNIGFNSEGTLVLFDLGLSNVVEPEPTPEPIPQEPFNSSDQRLLNQLEANSKWNYIYSQKAMPLPFDEDVSNESDSGSLIIDEHMSQESADKIKQKHNPNFLGQGNMGVAMMGQNPNHVLKITKDFDEFFVANLQMKKNFPFLVKVYSIEQVQDDPEMWLIEMDKVQTLDEWQILLNMSLRYMIMFPDDEQSLGFDQVYQETINEIKTDEEMKIKAHIVFEHSESEIMDFARKSYNLQMALMHNGPIRTMDGHGKNIGFTTDGRLVLFDLGRSEYVPDSN